MKVDLADITGKHGGSLGRLKIHLKAFKLDHYLKIKSVTEGNIGAPFSNKVPVCLITIDKLRELVRLYHSHPNVPTSEEDKQPTMEVLKEYLERIDKEKTC